MNNLGYLRKHNIYFLGIDVTQDLTHAFDKTKLENYLQRNFSFSVHGDALDPDTEADAPRVTI